VNEPGQTIHFAPVLFALKHVRCIFILTKCCHQMCFQALIMHQIRWRPGLCPGPHWGSLRCSPMPLSCIGRGHGPVHTLSHYRSTPSASCSASSALWLLNSPRLAPVLEMKTRRLWKWLISNAPEPRVSPQLKLGG